MSDDLAAWARNEQASLWHDLDKAIRAASNGVWSIQAGEVARRIVGIARLVGPSRNGEIPWPLVAGGVYEAVLTVGDVTPDLPTSAEWPRLEALMREHGGTREELAGAYAATVAAIGSPRERQYIRDE